MDRVVDSELVDSELVDSELMGSELVNSELMGGELVKSELMGSELVDSELMGSRLVSKPAGRELIEVGKVVVAELLDAGLLGGEVALVEVEPVEELLGPADDEIEPLVLEVENDEEIAATV